MFDNFFQIDIPGEVISSLIVMLIIVILAIIIAIQAHFQDPLKKPIWVLINSFNTSVTTGKIFS